MTGSVACAEFRHRPLFLRGQVRDAEWRAMTGFGNHPQAVTVCVRCGVRFA